MKKKIVSLVLVFALALALGIGGTVAWLTDDSETVTNTFTVGDINLSLAESTDANFKIVPGGTDKKDPTLTVDKDSEKCYVYVSVTNNVRLGNDVVATPNIDTTNWLIVGTNGNKTVYRYKDVIDASSGEVKMPVFTEVKYAETITKANIDTLKDTTIVIQGYAHQSENTTQAAADKAACDKFVVTAVSGT